MMDAVALAIVTVAGLYLTTLGVALLATPAAAARFLMGHASSGPLHLLELGLRIVVGVAFVHRAPQMVQPAVFTAFGWLLVATSSLMLLVPWRWHRRFAERSVAQALAFTPLIGVASLLMGVGVLVAAIGRAG